MIGKDIWVGLLLGLVGVVGCKKDSPPEKPASAPYQPTTTGVFIVNEGNFQFGNGEISYYDPGKGTVSNDVFKNANSRALGDVCQNMVLYRNLAYLVVNNSKKIEVVNPKTFKSTATITGFNSPRYFLPVDSTKAYVTDLYSNAISVVDLRTNTKTKDIPCRGWTEELIAYNGMAYVTNMKHSAIYLVNTQTDMLEDSISVGYASGSIAKDRSNKIWVLCQGDDSKHIKGGLYRLNAASRQIEQQFDFPAGQAPNHLRINGTADTLYYLNNGVCQMPVVAASLPGQSLISAAGHNFYGLNIDPNNGQVYVADAKDYQQQSAIYRYRTDGRLMGSFAAGLISNGFVFLQN